MTPNLPGKATHFRVGFDTGAVACGVPASGVRYTRNVGREVNCKTCLRTKAYKKAYRERVRPVGA